MKDITTFLTQKWQETNKLKIFESITSGILFGIIVLTWLNVIMLPIDDYLKTHTFENTDHIIIYSMLGFLITSLLSLLYLIRIAEYIIMKITIFIYNLYEEYFHD